MSRSARGGVGACGDEPVGGVYNGKGTENHMEHYTWDKMDKEILSETISRKIITGDKAMVAQVFLAKGAVVPEHHHESEQITYILEGALRFEIEGKTVV